MENNANNEVNSVTLSEWCDKYTKEDERRSVFLNMDKTLKYIHEHDYCIASFAPSDIYVLNNRDDCIQFRHLVELSADLEIKRRMIQEDIFNSSIIQLSIYSKIPISNINPEYIRENFDSFTLFLPQDDVAYYRGVIQRGASVYYCEYSYEKSKRDLDDYIASGEASEEEKKIASSAPSDAEMTNKKVNDLIYRQINGLRDAAYINLLVVPLVMVGILIIFIITTLLINFIR